MTKPSDDPPERPKKPGSDPDRLVLDAWALLAWLQGEEPAAELVTDLLERADGQATSLHMSWINLGEVAYILARRLGESRAARTVATLRRAPLTLERATPARVLAAARIKSGHRLSYADAFAAALALELDAPLVTGDPELRALAASTPLRTLAAR